MHRYANTYLSETLARANVVLIFSIGYAILQYELASGNGRTRTVLKDTLRVQHLKVRTRVGIILRKKVLKTQIFYHIYLKKVHVTFKYN